MNTPLTCRCCGRKHLVEVLDATPPNRPILLCPHCAENRATLIEVSVALGRSATDVAAEWDRLNLLRLRS